MKFLPINIVEESSLDLNRWRESVEDLAAAVAVGDVATRDELLLRFNQSIDQYRRHIESKLGEYDRILEGFPPEMGHFNQSVSTIQSNMALLYNELNSLRALTVAVFNRMATERQDFGRRLAIVSGKIRSLGLYNLTDFVGRYVGEHFTSAINFLLNNVPQPILELDINNGLVTLPVVEVTRIKPTTISLDSTISNGIVGNNEDINVTYNYSNIGNIIDDQPNTWWEYEVVKKKSFASENVVHVGLILTLQNEQIVNKIEITPLNLGTVSEIDIESVEGSTDGSNWFDLTSFMPLIDYMNEERKDLLSVSRSTSIRTNTVSLYLLPTYMRYIRIVMSQDEGVTINTNTGPALRFAIGLRDISIVRNQYASSGTLISRMYPVRPPVNTLLLFTAITNLQSKLFDAKFSLSFGDNQLVPITPIQSDALDTEVIETSSLSLAAEAIAELGFSLVLERNDSEFSSYSFNPQSSMRSETFVTSLETSPIVISSSHRPLEDTLSVMESPIFKVGTRFTLEAPQSSYLQGVGAQLELPLKLAQGDEDWFGINDIVIYVNGSPWTRVANLANSGIDAEHFALINLDKFKNTIVRFGNSGGTDAHRSTAGSSGGKSLPENAHVEIRIAPELLAFTYDTNSYVARFRLPFDGDINTLAIETQSRSVVDSDIVIPPGVKAYSLKPFINTQVTPSFTQYNTSGSVLATTVFVTEKSFIDGSTELINSDEYSIDPINGILHSYDASPTGRITVVTYEYFQRESMNPSGTSLVKEDNKFVGIRIPEELFKTSRIEETIGNGRSNTSSFESDSPYNAQYFSDIAVTYTAGDTTIYLSHGGIIPGTIEIPESLFGSGIATEVDYIDGVSEFLPGAGTSAFNLSTSTKYSIDYRRGVIHLPRSISTGQLLTYQYAQYRISYNAAAYIDQFELKGARIEISLDVLTKLSNGRIRIVYDTDNSEDSSTNSLAKYYTPVVRDVQIRYS